MKTTHLAPGLQLTVGTQPLPRLTLFLGLAALLLLLTGAALVGHAAVSPHKATTSHPCHTTQVTLQGTAEPTVTCLDGQRGTGRKATGGGRGPLVHVTPAVTLDGCYADSLAIYLGWDQSGPTMCINGTGGLNLNATYQNHWWNDDVISFWMGCEAAMFYNDINFQGGHGFAPGSPYGINALQADFPYQNAGYMDLSSIWVFSGGTC